MNDEKTPEDRERDAAMDKMTADLEGEEMALAKFCLDLHDLRLRMASLLAEAAVKVGTRMGSLAPHQAVHEADTRLIQLRVLGDSGAQLFAVLDPNFQPVSPLQDDDFDDADDEDFDGDDDDIETHDCGCELGACACDGDCKAGCGCDCSANAPVPAPVAYRSRRGSGSGRPS